MSLVSCHVQKHSTNTEGVTEYFISVVFIGKQWGIWKRYRDFLKFDEFLRNDDVVLRSELPPKKWWNRLDPTLIANRMKALQAYLDELLKCVSLSESSLLREFLEVDVINLQVAKEKSIKGINYNDRMKSIVNDASKNMVSISGIQRPVTQRNTSEKKDRKTGAMPIPMKMNNFDSNGSPLPSPSSSSFKGSPMGSSPLVGSLTGSFTRKALKRTESNASTNDYEKPLYERRFTFDRINSLGGLSPSSASANTVFGSALYEAASDGMKKDIFAQHVSKLWSNYQKQTEDILTDFEYKSLPVSLANNEHDCIKFLNEPLTIVEDLDQLLDTCADILLESSPKQTIAFISNDFVIEKFKTLPPLNNKNNCISRDTNTTNSNIETNMDPESPEYRNKPDTVVSETQPPSPRKLSKACRI